MIHYNMPDPDYRALPGISQSGLSQIVSTSPFHFKAFQTAKPPESDTFLFGRAVHHAILEPDTFIQHYTVAGAIDRRAKAGKEMWAELEAIGKTIIKEEMAEDIFSMQEAVMRHSAARELLADGQSEVSVTGQMMGIAAKGRIDWLDIGRIVDLKTTLSASPRDFAKSMASFNYHIQAAYYIDLMEQNGTPIDSFTFIAVEKKYPFAVAVYEIDESSISRGRVKYTEALKTYKACLDIDYWPCYGDGVNRISLPEWAS